MNKQIMDSVRFIPGIVILLLLLLYSAPASERTKGPCAGVKCVEATCDEINNYVNTALGSLGGDRSAALDADFVRAVIYAESRFHQCEFRQEDKTVVLKSPAGALGLMQLMPSTAEEPYVDVNPCFASPNVLGGVKYLNWLLTSSFRSGNYGRLEEYQNPQEFAAAAYNWGIGRVLDLIDKYCRGSDGSLNTGTCSLRDDIGLDKLPSETRGYVIAVMSNRGVQCGDTRAALPPPVERPTFEEYSAAEEPACGCHDLNLHVVALEGNQLKACSKACGANTDCVEDCESCCNAWCAGLSPECEPACIDRCFFLSDVDDLIESIRMVTIVIAAIIFAICGIQYLLLEGLEARAKAKKCLIYVIAGLVIIGIALELVSLMYMPITTPPAPPGPGPGPPPADTYTCAEVQAMIDAAAIGDTVTLDRDIIATGEDCLFFSNDDTQKTLQCAGHTILQDTANRDGVGIALADVTLVTITGCTIDNFDWGIALASANNNVITGNTITTGAGFGDARMIYLYDNSNGNTITNNVLSNAKAGVYLEGGSGNTVSGNNIQSMSQWGIWVSVTTTTTVTGNTITGSTEGIVLMASNGNDMPVSSNTISGGTNGIVVSDSSNFQIRNNQIADVSGNGIDIRVAVSENNDLSQNSVCNSGGTDIRQTVGVGINTGDNNQCDTVDNWRDAGEAVDQCTSTC